MMARLGSASALMLRHWCVAAECPKQCGPSLLRFRKKRPRPFFLHRTCVESRPSVVVVGAPSCHLLRRQFASARSYATVTQEDVEYFQSIIENENETGEELYPDEDRSTAPSSPATTTQQRGRRRGRVLVNDPDLVDPYNCDITKKYRGSASVVLLPVSTRQVSLLLQYCHDRRLPIVPQGGNTGLVGGGVGQGVVVSTKFMDQVLSFDPDEGVLSCQSGCVLQNLQQLAASHQWLVPIDLGAKGSCHMGGNVSTNAGGVYYYRYGSLASNLLGMEVVIPENGQVLRLGSSMRKDNTGYKLQNLMLGSEGTLGIVTRVTLQCHPLPVSRNAVWLICPNFASVLRVRHVARQVLGEILAAMEWMDSNIAQVVSNRQAPSASSGRSLDFLSMNGPNDSGRDSHHHHLLIETHGSHPDHDEEKMTEFLERVLEEGAAVHGVLAQSLEQQETFWSIRESCNPAMAALGYTYKYDVSLPVNRFEDFLHEIRERIQLLAKGNDVLVASWGHILDGNVHLNVHRTNDRDNDPALSSFLDDLVFDLVVQRGGSISAEHGIGVAKKKYLPRIHDDAVLRTMKGIKEVFDPHDILNPGKLF